MKNISNENHKEILIKMKQAFHSLFGELINQEKQTPHRSMPQKRKEDRDMAISNIVIFFQILSQYQHQLKQLDTAEDCKVLERLNFWLSEQDDLYPRCQNPDSPDENNIYLGANGDLGIKNVSQWHSAGFGLTQIPEMVKNQAYSFIIYAIASIEKEIDQHLDSFG